MNKETQSALNTKFQILDATTNNRSKKFIVVMLVSIATLTFLFSFNHDNKNNSDSPNTNPVILIEHKNKIIKAQREESQGFLKTAKTALRKLDGYNLKDWDPIKNQKLNELFENGESMHRLRRYFEADKLFKDVITKSNEIILTIPRILETKIQDSYFYLEKSQPLAAIKSFNYALKIEPHNERALAGLKMAKNFNEVKSLFIQADQFESIGQNADALNTYYKIIQLDPNATEAQHAINRIEFDKKEKAYRKLYNKGHTLLQSKRFKEATLSFQEAQKIFPNRRDLDESLSETLDAETNYLINNYIKKARSASKQNNWITASKNYEKALQLDNNLAEGIEGLTYSNRRKELDQQIMSVLNNKEHPVKQSTFERTKKVLKLALVHKEEPFVASQIYELNKVLAEIKKKVPVLFISDNQTQVILANSINLGTFNSQKFRLAPGKHLITGKRKGFRKVSKNLIISTDKTDNQVYIICNQKQRI